MDSAGSDRREVCRPLPAGRSEGTARLYTDHFYQTASGKAQFHAVKYQPVAEAVNARYPFRLLTGRLRDQWHGMSRTGLVARLYSHESEPMLHMHKDDMARRQLADGDLVKVRSRRGDVVLKVLESATLRAGQCFVPMHWGANATGGLGVNVLLPDRKSVV